MNIIIKCLLSTTAVLILIAGLLLPAKAISYVQKDEAAPEAPAGGRPAADRLDRYLDALEQYECRDCAPGYKMLDANNRYSFGCLQFQEQTFVGMARDFALYPEAEDQEILNFIDDCAAQKKLARLMFEKDEVWAAHHWYTSIYVRGLGLPSDFEKDENKPTTQ